MSVENYLFMYILMFLRDRIIMYVIRLCWEICFGRIQRRVICCFMDINVLEFCLVVSFFCFFLSCTNNSGSINDFEIIPVYFGQGKFFSVMYWYAHIAHIDVLTRDIFLNQMLAFLSFKFFLQNFEIYMECKIKSSFFLEVDIFSFHSQNTHSYRMFWKWPLTD